MAEAHSINCRICGTEFAAPNRRFKVCSRACSVRLDTAKKTARRAAKRADMTCAECASPFAGVHSGQKYCGAACARRVSRRNYWSTHARPPSPYRPLTTPAARLAAKEYFKEYYRRNREAYFVRALAYRNRVALAAGRSTAVAVAARIEYWGNRCWMCYGPAEAVDHVKPLSKGGSNWPANLRPACRACNSAKRDKWPFPTAGGVRRKDITR